MRLKKASLTFAGAAAAVAVTTMAASPAWACNDRDPSLKLESICGKLGPLWKLTNPNNFNVPATWKDNKGGRSVKRIDVPARSSIPLSTHATVVIVTAYRIDQRNLPVWQNHGAFGKLLKSCQPAKPEAPKPPQQAPKPSKPSAKPTEAKPAPVPSGEARPATPVKAQPAFTG
jgi:hypothetical protein